MVKGFRGILDKARAFGPAKLITARVMLPQYKYGDVDKRREYFDRASESLSATPGVATVCLFTTPPFSNNGTRWREFSLQGPEAGKRLPAAVVQAVSGNYFQVMSIPISAGRAFEGRDSATALPVAIVSEGLARHYWPGRNALGEQVRLGKPESPGPWLTVVGVVGDVEYDWTDNEPEPTIYIPYPQIWSSLDPEGREGWAATYFGARTSVEPVSLIPTLRRQLTGVDPDVPTFGWETLDKVMTASLAGVAEVGGMMTGAGLMALILAVVGIYGVSAFSVEQRTREIGIRIALGAKQRRILILVLKRGSAFIAAGLALGMAGALALMPLLSAFFYGVRPTDPPTLLSVSVLLAAVAVLATYIPARQATKVDPIVALRYE
jgi:putative ABC transport system permease protein